MYINLVIALVVSRAALWLWFEGMKWNRSELDISAHRYVIHNKKSKIDTYGQLPLMS